MDYVVGFRVDARCYVHVEANSPEEAMDLAENEICCVDPADLEWVEYAPIYAEDENGNLYDF